LPFSAAASRTVGLTLICLSLVLGMAPEDFQ